MSDECRDGVRSDTVVAAAVALSYSIGKVGHALDGRAGIPGGPTITAASADGAGDLAAQQWMLVALGVLAAAIALSSGVTVSRRGVARARWITLSGAALLVSTGAVVIVSALFEAAHPLRWSQPIAATMAIAGALSWIHLAVRLRPTP